MNSDSKNMIKKIVLYDCFIGLIFTAVIWLTFKLYALFFLLGLILASITLLLNLISVNFILCNTKIKCGVITFLGFAFRVILVCVIGLVVFNYYNFSIIAFILGYSSQLISLVLYGVNIKECEGK